MYSPVHEVYRFVFFRPLSRFGLFFAVATVAILFLFPSASTNADILHTRNGQSMEGRVVEEKEDRVVFESAGARVEFFRSEIDHIEKKAYRAPILPKVEMPSFSNGAQSRRSPAAKPSRSLLEEPAWLAPVREWTGAFNEQWPWAVTLFVALMQYLAAAWTAKVFLSIGTMGVRYHQTLLFQLKCLLVGILISVVLLFLFGFLWAVTAGPVTERNAMVVAVLAWSILLIVNVIVFYVFARRDFDAGFSTAFLLSIVIGITYMVVDYTGAHLGFEYQSPLNRFMQEASRAAGLS